MEKSTPHYDLAVIKADVRRLGRKAFTTTAKNSGRTLGLNLIQMQEVVFELQGKMLTTYYDHRVWQDVYHINSYGMEIYIKVTYRPGGGPPVISFKEKSQ